MTLLLTSALAISASVVTAGDQTTPSLPAVPATPVMTVYLFGGKLDVPVYDAEAFARSGPEDPVGSLAVGTSLIPCLVIFDGHALTDSTGTPYVGFDILVDPTTATYDSVAGLEQAITARDTMLVSNHHCAPGNRRVINVRKLVANDSVPYLAPPPAEEPLVSVAPETAPPLVSVDVVAPEAAPPSLVSVDVVAPEAAPPSLVILGVVAPVTAPSSLVTVDRLAPATAPPSLVAPLVTQQVTGSGTAAPSLVAPAVLEPEIPAPSSLTRAVLAAEISAAPSLTLEVVAPEMPGASAPLHAAGEIDALVRAFHNSSECKAVEDEVTGRRERLEQAWKTFMAARRDDAPPERLDAAKQLDYAMRTALFEGHIDRGCSAYGACERNIIVLSLRNRASTQCLGWQGCRHPGDVQGVASSVSQYNIWDEYLTQVSSVSTCFLREDQGEPSRLAKMYAQTVNDAERILFADAAQLGEVFPGVARTHLTKLRHYYHPPAMGKCFPDHPNLEYVSGAVATNGTDHVLIANARIEVDERKDDGYTFRDAVIEFGSDGDEIELVDAYPGFVIDGRKISLQKPPASCVPWGVPEGCGFETVGRWRRTPPWLEGGTTAELTCNVVDLGESCTGEPQRQPVAVGGVCDTEMQPVSEVH